jgi:acyl-coenzyme A synthetase/AMP-(fatty) acid ligase
MVGLAVIGVRFAWVFATDLPRLPSGKIQRRLVRAPYWEGRSG